MVSFKTRNASVFSVEMIKKGLLTDLVVVIFLLNLINLNLIDLKFKHIILALLSSLLFFHIIIPYYYWPGNGIKEIEIEIESA